MRRSQQSEIMDRFDLPDDLSETIHRDLARTNRVLGNTAAIVQAVRRDSKPVQRVLDVGCGNGSLMASLQRQLNVDVVGVDLRVPKRAASPLPIVEADAVHDRLPDADVAVCALVAHHLSESDVIALIRNVGRSCRRLVLLDLVRSRLPLFLFRLFVAPFVSTINASDGQLSIRRAYTRAELNGLVARALVGTRATFTHSVGPLRIRQVIDISF
jgi:SAM-dependent methyltransferase